jgi:hypothetical protein
LKFMTGVSIQYDFVTILEVGGVLWVAFWLVGVFALWLGSHAARKDFRGKGYVRPPSGREWFPFLLEKRYEIFEASSIRFFFKISHVCLMAMIFILAGLILLVGIDTLFKSLSGP